MGCCHHETESEAGCPACEFDPFVKNHFFTGKMMGAREFMTETAFHAEKMRHHNARLHGWGVVCGLLVEQHPEPACQVRFVRVQPGTAIDCCGHEILLPEPEFLDIPAFPSVRKLQAGKPPSLHALQVCVRFKECPTEEVPVLYDECGCDDTQCAPNRILESYEFDVLVDPPLSRVTRVAPADIHGVFVPSATGAPMYAPVTDGRYVHLISPASPDQIVQLDLVENRRMVWSMGAKIHSLTVVDVNAGIGTQKHMLFAVTDPKAPETGEQRIRVLATDTGTPIDAADRKIAASSTASIVSARGSTTAARLLLTHERASGQVVPWPQDAATGIAIAPGATLASVLPNLSEFTVRRDGAVAYAIDAPGNKIRRVDLAADTVADLAGPAAAATPVALAALTLAGVELLIVASWSATDQSLYVLNTTTNAVLTLPLERKPVRVLAMDDGHVYVYEEESGTGYLQVADVAPLTTGGIAEISAARLIGKSATAPLVVFARNGSALLLDGTAYSSGSCDDILWAHVYGCPDCDSPNCVVLGTISNYRVGARMVNAGPGANPADAQIDYRLGRRVLASTQTLQAWIECLESKGGIVGPQGPGGANGTNGLPGGVGPPGPGLEEGLVQISDITWKHNARGPFLVRIRLLASSEPTGEEGIVFTFTDEVTIEDGNDVTIRRPDAHRALEVLVRDLPEGDRQQRQLTVCRCSVMGHVVPVAFLDQNDPAAGYVEIPQPSSNMWGFVFDKELLARVRRRLPADVFVRLRGDFVIDRQRRAIDAEFPRAALPSGDRPATAPGNKFGIQGGVFESWFWLERR